jgi:hypothetical protein
MKKRWSISWAGIEEFSEAKAPVRYLEVVA